MLASILYFTDSEDNVPINQRLRQRKGKATAQSSDRPKHANKNASRPKKVSGNKNASSSSTPVNELEPVHND